VPAIQLEKLTWRRSAPRHGPRASRKAVFSDREVIDRHLTRVTVRPTSIDIELSERTAALMPPVTTGPEISSNCTTVSSACLGACRRSLPSTEFCIAILLAIAKARSWINDIASGRVQSFDEIAEREGKVERHIRLLTPLAFIPPYTLSAIIDGTGRHDVTVTALAQAAPYRWDGGAADQSRGKRESATVDAITCRLIIGWLSV
jgi:site-specific DNA recombinase